MCVCVLECVCVGGEKRSEECVFSFFLFFFLSFF